MSRITINGNCTPRMQVALDYDENEHGYPVLWISILIDSLNEPTNRKLLGVAPLDKEAVNKLIVELQKLVTEM